MVVGWKVEGSLVVDLEVVGLVVRGSNDGGIGGMKVVGSWWLWCWWRLMAVVVGRCWQLQVRARPCCGNVGWQLGRVVAIGVVVATVGAVLVVLHRTTKQRPVEPATGRRPGGEA